MVLAVFLLLASGAALASGGSSMGGGGGYSMPMQRKSPHQIAVEDYNTGLKHRDRAKSYMKELQTQQNPRKVAWLKKHINREFDYAAKLFRKAIAHDDSLYQADGSLGYALRKTGHYSQALKAYNRALALNPEYTEAIEYRAEAYLALGRFDDTKQSYMHLMKRDRPRADELMKAIEAWLADPPKNATPESVSALKQWATERMQLGALTSDLAGTAKTDWSPD